MRAARPGAVPAWKTSAPGRPRRRGPRSGRPARGAAGIAGRGEHHRHAGLVGRRARGAVLERARPPPRPAAPSRSLVQAGQHGLGLGVAEARVELEHARAVGGQHEPGVEHAPEGASPGGPSRPPRAGAPRRSARRRAPSRDVGHRATPRPCRRCWARGRPSPIALVVARGGKARPPVCRRRWRAARPRGRSALLDQRPSRRRRRSPARPGSLERARGPRPRRRATTTPLPAARPSALTATGGPSARDGGQPPARSVTVTARAVGHPGGAP